MAKVFVSFANNVTFANVSQSCIIRPTLTPLSIKIRIHRARIVLEERDMLKTIEHFFKAASRNDSPKYAEITSERTNEMQDMCHRS